MSLTQRRLFLKTAAGLTGTALSGQRVPWSSGSETPHLKAPANATDCHHHIYDSRFPMNPAVQSHPGDATVADYRLFQRRIGTMRNIVVLPSPYGVDNRCLLDALSQFGVRARGIAVVHPDVSDSDLKLFDQAGVRGLRFTLAPRSMTSIEMVEPLAKRAAALGWHIQINGVADRILAAMPVFSRLPVPVVFDHLAHAPSAKSPLFAAVAKLLQSGKAWVKLSGAYVDTKVGPPTYADTSAVAKAFVKEAPQRLVWGSDWPHPSEKNKPDDALLFDLLAQWAPRESIRAHILVHNPAKLYGFA
ncbi:MAG TPA: amidohydrolase family protein [Bryobacteraceae bacterium]